MKILKHNLVYLFSLLIFLSGFAMLFSHYCHAESNNTMIWPLSGPITSEYGWRTHPIYGTQKFHSGLDIGGEYGLPIQAAAAGTVIYADWMSGYGNTVMIDHGGGVVTLYGHNESLNVQVGQLVGQGQIIAMCGSTGNSTGPHCHFEVEVNGDVVDPNIFLSADGHMPPYGGSDFFKSDYNFLPMDFNAANDIAKPMKEETDAVVDACLKAMKILREKLAGLLIVLMTIDLALAAMWQLFRDYVPSGSGQSNWSLRSFINWLLRRMIFYGILVFIFNNWTDYYVNIIMDLFTGMGGVAADKSAKEIGDMLSDTTDLVQHGVSLLGPLFNAIGNQPVTMIFHNPISLIVTLVLALIIILLWMAIGIGISMCYIEFYVVAVFAFTMFCFNGLEQLRTYGSKSISSVLVCGMEVFFYSIFVGILSLMCKELSVSYVEGNNIQIMPMIGTIGLQVFFIYFGKHMYKTITQIFHISSDFRFRVFNGENQHI